MEASTMKNLLIITLFIFLIGLCCPSTCFAQGIKDAPEYAEEIFEDDWDEEDETLIINDPHEGFNRKMFKFNNWAYTRVFEPLSKGYDFLIPKKVQTHINKLFDNARFPVRFFNNLFQKKVKGATTELGRFVINSSVGIGGLFDPAKAAFKLEPYKEDFGQTLGFYNVNEGSYFVWPIFGPSTRRDTIGWIGDTALNPFTWFSIYDLDPEDVLFGVRVVKRVNNFSYNVRDSYNSIVDRAIDPYTALQHAYVQNRRKKIED